LYALQDHIDAQSGGPGKGWLRIVTNPFQARRVISQGKLAVVEGIEGSPLFGGGQGSDVPHGKRRPIDAGRKGVPALGASTFFRFVYGIRDGRVRFVAVAQLSELSRTRTLRSDLHAAGM